MPSLKTYNPVGPKGMEYFQNSLLKACFKLVFTNVWQDTTAPQMLIPCAAMGKAGGRKSRIKQGESGFLYRRTSQGLRCPGSQSDFLA